MASLSKSFFKLSTLLYLILAFSGCALMGSAVVPAAVSGGAVGINYTLTNNAYKTISSSVADVEAALHKALQRMDIRETNRRAKNGKVSITAITSNLNIYIDLEKVTPAVTNIEINAQKGAFFKDKATAAEIIVQTEKNLGVKK